MLRKGLVGGVVALGLAGALSQPAGAVISVSPTADPNVLINSIIGPGVTVVPGSVRYVGGSAEAAGTFSNGVSSGIGIDTGITLSTGNAATAAIVPNQDGTTINHNNLDQAGPDGDLDDLLQSIASEALQDQNVLQFQFTTTTGNLFFDYAFASEEYNQFANTQFNDVFGLFVDGVNVALLPGTTTPVSINTVNGGNPLGTDAQNPQFYRNNDLTDGGPFFDFGYDGFTTVFQARALNLGAGVHTFNIAIGDVVDGGLDSAVFIRGGSVTAGPSDPPPPDDGSIPEPLTASLGTLSAVALGLFSMRRQR